MRSALLFTSLESTSKSAPHMHGRTRGTKMIKLHLTYPIPDILKMVSGQDKKTVKSLNVEIPYKDGNTFNDVIKELRTMYPSFSKMLDKEPDKLSCIAFSVDNVLLNAYDWDKELADNILIDAVVLYQGG